MKGSGAVATHDSRTSSRRDGPAVRCADEGAQTTIVVAAVDAGVNGGSSALTCILGHVPECQPNPDYERLADEHRPTADTWDAFVRTALVEPWLRAYRAATPWRADVMEIAQGALVYLFDAAPTMDGLDEGDDRVVAVWGHSRRAGGPRDRGRQAGFIPNPQTWSHAGRDRGHFVAHAAGGGMDMNFFPQAAGLNRGTTRQGRAWKAMERHAIEHPGTALFVRPVYEDVTWVPASIDVGTVVEGRLRSERFSNRDEPDDA